SHPSDSPPSPNQLKRKMPKSSGATMVSPPPSDQTSQIDDADVTPRAPSPSKRRRLDLSSDQVLPFRQPDFASDRRFPDDLSSQPSSTKTSTTDRKSNRSRSPVKSMLDLRLAEKPMETIILDTLDQLPPNATALFASSLDASQCRNIIPHCMRERVQAAKSILDPALDAESHYYDIQSWAESHSAKVWDAVEELRTLQKIAARSREAELMSLTEPAWNARVHEPLLDVALEPFGDSVSHWDVTRASINKPYLGKHSSGAELQAKMVDFCITLNGKSMAKAVWKRLETASDNHSINHSSTSPLREHPIAISIETKAPGGSRDEAKAQLSVWVTSHLKRLRTLSGPSKNLNTVAIALPVVEVHGGEWSLLFLRDGDEDIQLIQTVKIGDTKSIVGCYQVVAFLRHLGFWATSVYR
ncbi:hypothetical protein BGZ63DRAFT_325613, partial [Mariannaea sp. PMI_226]